MLRRVAILAAVFLCVSPALAEVAGRVNFVAGAATVADSRGQRTLARQTDLSPGDTVRTAGDGRVQIRFTDGAYVSLQPNTEFAIRDYHYDAKADGEERGVFGLARGALRAVTGLIGRVNRHRYQIYTPTATIGVRGTGGRIAILEDGSTLIQGTSGIWTLSNPSGTIDVPAGTSGRAPADPGQAPYVTSEQPRADPAPAVKVSFSQGEQQDTPASQVLPAAAAPASGPPLVTGSIYHVSTSWVSSAGDSPASQSLTGTSVNATFNAQGQMTAFAGGESASFTGTHQEFGTAGGIIAWGRWTGPVSGLVGLVPPTPFSINPAANEGFAYVVGIPATAMPTTGSATFNLIGATRPVAFGGTLAPGTFSGSLNVNFAGSITINATATFPTFSTSVVNGVVGFTPGQPVWGFALVPATVSGAPPPGFGCTAGCNAGIDGAFYGPGATYAGFSYSLPGSIAGTAAFKR